MIGIDWQLTLLSLGVVPLIVAAIYFFAKRIRSQSTAIHERDSALLAQTQEGLSSIRMVHAFGREEWEVRQFQDQAQRSLQANLRLTLTNVNSALVISTLMVVGTAAMYYVGTLHVLNGTLTLGSLLVFSAYLLMLYQPLESLTYTTWAMEGAAAGAQRCFEVLDRADDVVDCAGRDTPSRKRPARSRFENVSFGYAADQPVLSDIDLEIAPSQIVGIVGGTGAGKSTLLSLVPRFYDPTRRTRHPRWPRPAADHEKIAARPDRHRPPGHAPLLHHRAREHRLRPARRDRGGNPRGRAPRAGR